MDKRGEQMKSLLISYKAVFNTPTGQVVLKDLMANNHVFVGTFDKDAMTMAFREGQRAVIMDILSKINMDVDAFTKAYQEQADGLDL